MHEHIYYCCVGRGSCRGRVRAGARVKATQGVAEVTEGIAYEMEAT